MAKKPTNEQTGKKAGTGASKTTKTSVAKEVKTAGASAPTQKSGKKK
jgi:hypothetical protein